MGGVGAGGLGKGAAIIQAEVHALALNLHIRFGRLRLEGTRSDDCTACVRVPFEGFLNRKLTVALFNTRV